MAEIRGMIVADGSLYTVAGAYVFKITTADVKTYVGSLDSSTGPVHMASNGTEVLITDDEKTCTFQDGYFIINDMPGDGYVITLDGDWPPLAAIEDADFPTTTSTGKLFISGSYDGTSWDALDYATAEADPDDLLAVLSDHREAWCFGHDTTEVYYNSGDADFPFERMAGGIIEEGIIAPHSAAKAGNTICWLSRKGQVLKVDGYNPIPISTAQIEYQLSQYADLTDGIGFSYTKDGHTFYVLTFPTDDATWVYDLATGFWHERTSYIDAETRGRWRAQNYVKFNGAHLVGDHTNGKIYEIDEAVYTDNFHSVQRIRRAQSINKGRLRVKHHTLEIEFESGVGVAANPTAAAWSAATTYDQDEYCISGGKYYVSLLDSNLNNEPPDAEYWEEIESDIWTGEDPQAAVSWSDNGGHTFNSARNKAMGASAAYSKRAVWKKLKSSRDRVYNVEVVAPVKVVIIAAHLRVTGGRH